MSFALLKYFAKKNWTLWLGITAFMLFEFVIMIFMMELIADMLSNMSIPGVGSGVPEGKPNGAYALEYISNLYPMYACLFPLIFVIMISIKLMAKPIDTTSMSSFLSAGIKRSTYVTTAAVFVASSLFAMFFLTFIICGLCMLYWGSINWGSWLLLNVCFLFVNLAIMFICFILSTAFSATKYCMALVIGTPVIMFLIHMFAEYLTWLKYFTLLGWIDQVKIINGNFDMWFVWLLFYGTIATGLAIASVFIFRKKQLSI